MKNYARVINNVAVDVSTNPQECFTPEIAAQFEEVPAKVKQGWVRIDSGSWSAPAPTPEAVVVESKRVSPVEFKLLFTSAERIAIKGVRETDAVVDDFFDIVDDPRLTYVDLGLQSTKDALAYLASQNLITETRRDEILAGQVQ